MEAGADVERFARGAYTGWVQTGVPSRMPKSSGEEGEMVRRIGMREFRANMAGFLRQVHAGSTFLVTSRDEVLAEIHPPSRSARPPRRPGALRGQIRMADDFDVLPPDVIAAMEG